MESKSRLTKLRSDFNTGRSEDLLIGGRSLSEIVNRSFLPFPEFSDQDINSEKWDKPFINDKIGSSIEMSNEDPLEVRVPPGITVQQWKRCVEINPNFNYVVFSPISGYPDLITSSRHLLKCEFYKNFISSMETLLFIGCTKPFQAEYNTPVFSGAAGVGPWRPWHHIYSNCKITKGDHIPVYNPTGKYIVRLFWLGAWRKIYVDDKLPLDISGNVLLPSLKVLPSYIPTGTEEIQIEKPSKGKAKGVSPVTTKETFELWPMILCKALLKIASLSSFNEFDLMHCLTGWVPQNIKTTDISTGDLWDMLTAYVERFKWADTEESAKKTGSTKTKSKEKENATPSKKDVKEAIPSGIENMKGGDRFVVVFCRNYSQPAEANTVSDCESRTIFISEIRDVPIIKPPPRPELEFWKTFRYEKWAVEKGIIPPDIKKLDIRSLRVVDPFKRLIQGHSEIPVSEASLSFLDIDNTEKKSEKSHKSSKKPQKPEKTNLLEPDPSTWMEFSDIQDKIGHFTIYFQPRTFKSKIVISDLHFPNKSPEFNYISHPYVLKKTRNEPIYVFMDSIDYKFLVINLAQMGNLSTLEKVKEEEGGEVIANNTLETLDICDEILRKKAENIDVSTPPSQVYYKYSESPLQNRPVSLVLEEYRWESNTIGSPRVILNTIGTKSFIIDLKPGRASFRLWISSNCPYVLQIFSDTPINIGDLEGYLVASSMESQLLTNLCYDISSCFGKLVQSFGMPEYSVSLRNFYESYKPIEHLSKKELATIHRIFFEEFCKIISENSTVLYGFSSTTVDVVKILFLQLKTFDYISPYTEEPHLCPNKFPLDEQVEYAKRMQRAAVKIQAFFKMVYIKQMMKKMNDEHKEYYEIFEILKWVYSELFSSDKRLNYCPVLIRRFFEHPEMKHLRSKFHICHDIQSVLELHVYNENLVVQESSWVSFCRYEFHVNSKNPILIKINLFCNLQKYVLRVFDNDNLREIKRTLEGVIVDAYCMNSKGYTILCYGWCNELSRVNWKLIIAYKKTSINNLILIPGYALTTSSLKDQYVPNFENIICRYKLKVCKDILLTANLTTSYDQVRLCFRLLDKNGKVLREICGNRSVLFPLLDLRCASENGPSEPYQASKQRVATISLCKEASLVKLKKPKRHASMTSSESNASHRRSKKSATLDNFDADDESTISAGSVREGKNSLSKSKTSTRSPAAAAASSSGRVLSRGAIILGAQYAQTEYVLEAKVVGNSWPLTADEWQRVQRVQEKNYLNLLDDRKPIGKKPPAPRKLSMALLDPYWILDLFYIAGSYLEFEQDNSQAEMRKNKKIKWFADIERYKRAVLIREKYLQENSVPNVDVLPNKYERSNNPKVFATSIVEEVPLEDRMTKPLEEVDEDSCKTKSNDDYIIEEANIEYKMKHYEAEEEATQEEIDSQLEEQAEAFDIMSQWFEEIRNDSQDMFAEVHAMEKEYVDQVRGIIKNGKKNKEKNKK